MSKPVIIASELISIILPVYNSEKYIKECLLSILNQTYNNWELLIIDDGSTDNSKSIVCELLPFFKSNQVKLIELSHHGLPYCLNFAINKANGKYIARIDADDIMLPTRLEKQIIFLDANKDIDILGTNAFEINDSGETFAIINKPLGDEKIKKAFCYDCPVLHPSVMMRKSLFKQNLYNELYPAPEDFELWIRLMPFVKFENLQEPLLKKRKHFAQTTHFNNGVFIWRCVKLNVLYNIKKREFRYAIVSLRPLLFLLLPNSLVIWVKAKKQKKQLLKFRQSNSL